MNIFHNDAYQLSMLYAHWKNGRTALPASAEAFFRRYPHDDDQNMVVMAGAYRINKLLNSDLREPFKYEDMAFIQSTLHLSDEEFEPFQTYLLEVFPQELSSLKVSYVREGEVLYWDFPVVQVCGPLGAVHMLETPILSILNHSVRAATVARRLRREAGDRVKLLDFATRRQDPDSAVHTAVAAIIGGFDGTSNLEAGRVYYMPVGGTMAHAYVLSYGMHGELEAFKAFLHTYPTTHTLLVDTFDIMTGVGNAIRAALETGIVLRAVRLDSGDWPVIIPEVRRMLDLMGCQETKIAVSGDYDLELIRKLKATKMPNGKSVFSLIDVIGIGSHLSAPGFSMGFVYKLVEIQGEPVMKLAGSKVSLPCKKVWIKTPTRNCGTNKHPMLPAGNVLTTWNSQVLEDDVEVVLQEDGGLFPVSMEYVQDARKLTAKRVASKEGFWVKGDVLNVAESIRG